MKTLIGLLIVFVSSFAHATEIVYRPVEARGNKVQFENGMGFGEVMCNSWHFQAARGRYLSVYLDRQAANESEVRLSRMVRLAVPFQSEQECLLAKTALLSKAAELVMNLEGDSFTGEKPIMILRSIENRN